MLFLISLMSFANFLATFSSEASIIILIFGSVPDGLTRTLPTVKSDSISDINLYSSLSFIISLFFTFTAMLI